MGLAHIARTVRNLVDKTWQRRSAYATPVDVYKGFTLRTALGRTGRKIFPPREVKLNVPGAAEPLWVRRTTSDFQVFAELFEQYEYDIVGKLQLPEAPIIFDFGGNIGLGTRRMSMLLPKARFLVVEPDAENRRMYRKNNESLLAANRVTLIEGFVSARDGVAAIDRSSGNASGFHKREAGAQDKELIQCYSPETLMNKAGVQNIDLVKVDIEGAEAELFANCGGWVHAARHIMIECHEPYTYQKFFDDLNRAGWKFDIVEQNHAMTCVRRA